MNEKRSTRDFSEQVPSGRVLELLEIGAQLFAEKGYEATSMRDIAKAAGVSKALLYHHFKGKDDMYSRISYSATQDLFAYVSGFVPENGTASDKVRAFMVAGASFFAEHRSAWITASNSFWTDPDRHRLETRMERRRQFEYYLRSLIQEGIDSGEFSEVDPAITGRLILSGINWMNRWFDPSEEQTAEEIVSQYADIILCGITRQK